MDSHKKPSMLLVNGPDEMQMFHWVQIKEEQAKELEEDGEIVEVVDITTQIH